jgi:iron complex transport system substrate-binding protein
MKRADSVTGRRHLKTAVKLALALLGLTLAGVFISGRIRSADAFGSAGGIRLDPQKDYFPDKAGVKYAKGFAVRYFPNYKILDILNPFGSGQDTTRYVLVPKGAAHPSGFPGAQFVEIPIQSLICLSTTHIGLTALLDANDLIIGLEDTVGIYNSEVRKRIGEGRISEVGRSNALKNELVISLDPDLVMAVGMPPTKSGSYKSLVESGVPVLVNSEYMENTPLGRAEWVKLLAFFLNKERLAEEKFGAIEARYREISRLAKGVEHKPTAISNIGLKGAWFVPGGNSFPAAWLKDAGADYHWAKDTTKGSLQLNFEAVYEVGLDAEYWFNPGQAKTLSQLTAMDSRYRAFRSFKSGNVFTFSKRQIAGGGNDYWESGLVNPDRILSDIIRILHPDLLPDHELIYYRKLGP